MDNIEKQILLKIKNKLSPDWKGFNNLREFKNLQDTNPVLGWDLLIYLVGYQEHKNILNKTELEYLIKNSNLKNHDYQGESNALLLLMAVNKKQGYNLSPQLWDYLIKNSNLQRNTTGRNALTNYLIFKDRENIVLMEETIDYLVETCQDCSIETVLSLALNQKEDIIIKKMLTHLKITKVGEIEKLIHGKRIISKINEMIEREQIIEKISEIKPSKKRKPNKSKI